jgi:16S rRNA (cytosine967-C5)-methyltransferase
VALDLCAAPGGKSVLLAAAAGAKGRVIAADIHLHRLRAVRETFHRTQVGNVLLCLLNGEHALPFHKPFERILVDAPCSGTGTLARNPEIRWRLKLEDLAELHQRQVGLLRNALDCLAPGGRLVYSTCSLEPEENEEVVAAALEARSTVIQVRPTDLPKELLSPDGSFRTNPAEHGTDGFFAAVLERAVNP